MPVGVRLLSLPGLGLAAALLLCMAAACTPRQPSSGDARHLLAGRVTAVEPQPGLTRVRVQGDAEPSEFVLLVRPGTPVVVRSADGSDVPARLDQVVPGVRIEAEHDGVQMRSLAPRYEATRIRIIPGS